jgi:thioester reductase-like protein
VLGEEVASPSYWLEHARRPTRFADALEALHELGCRQTIELGPGREGHLLASAMQTWIGGARIDWSALNRPRPTMPPSLPTYPFQHRRHWLPEGEGALEGGPRTVATPLPQQITEAPLSTRSHRYLAEHRVHGHTVVPGVTYLQLLLPDGEDSGGAARNGITQLTLLMPLIAASDRRYTLQAILDPTAENGAREGRLYSREPGSGGAWTLHATARIGAFPEPVEQLVPLEEIRSRLNGPTGGEEFYGEAWHPDFELGESFRLLDRVWSGHGEALGRVLVADPNGTAVRDGIRPELLTLDACAQLLLAAATAGRRPAAGSPALLGAGFERFASRQTEIGDAVWCWARLDDGDPGATGSLLLASDDGECLAEVRGVAFRPVAAETLRRLSAMAPASDGTPARGEGAERPAAPRANELRELGAEDRAAAIREYLQSRLGLVLGMQPSELDPERSISDFADSLMLAELKGEVEAELDMTVPLELLFEAPTLAGLASWLSAALGADGAQEKQRPPSTISPTPASGSMSVAELSEAAALDPTIAPSTNALSTAEPRAVLLTGATEHVGAYTLAELLARTDAEVHCLLGERDPQRALEAIAASMRRFELDGWDSSRVFPVFGDLPSPWLGLGEAGARRLAERLDAIYHLASASQWARSFATLAPVNVDGTREVLRLATSARPLPVHHFSTVGVFSSPGYGPGPVAESEPLERSGDLPLPYAQTRWVAERMVQTAGERGLPVTVHRAAIGPAAGTGAFDPSHHIPLMLKACVETGAAPEWDAPVQLAPVDYVAGAIVELSLRADMRGRVFHLVTPEGLTWNELGELLRAFGYRLGRESPRDWSERLAATQYGDLGLLTAIVESIEGSRLPWFDCAQTRAALDGASLTCPPLDELLALSLPRMVASGFLTPPAATNGSPLRTSTPALDQTERTD